MTDPVIQILRDELKEIRELMIRETNYETRRELSRKLLLTASKIQQLINKGEM